RGPRGRPSVPAVPDRAAAAATDRADPAAGLPARATPSQAAVVDIRRYLDVPGQVHGLAAPPGVSDRGRPGPAVIRDRRLAHHRVLPEGDAAELVLDRAALYRHLDLTPEHVQVELRALRERLEVQVARLVAERDAAVQQGHRELGPV